MHGDPVIPWTLTSSRRCASGEHQERKHIRQHVKKVGKHLGSALHDVIGDFPLNDLPVRTATRNDVVLEGVEVEGSDLVRALEDHVGVDEVPEAPDENVVGVGATEGCHTLTERGTASQCQCHHSLQQKRYLQLHSVSNAWL